MKAIAPVLLVIGLVVGVAVGVFVPQVHQVYVTETSKLVITETQVETVTGGATTIPETLTALQTVTDIVTERATVTETETAVKTTTEPPEETTTGEVGYSRSNPAPIGVTLYTEFHQGYVYKGKGKFTVLQVIRGEEAWKMVDEASKFNNPPHEGFEYILAKIRFEYIEGPRVESVPTYGFCVFSEHGVEYNSAYLWTPVKPDLGDINVKLYPGTSHEGWETFEVFQGDLHPLLRWSETMYREQAIWFKLYYES